MAIIYSWDIETGGLNPNNCSVLEIGIIKYDTINPSSFEDSPKFHCLVDNPTVSGSAFALNMNARIFRQLIDKDYKGLILKPHEVIDHIYEWLRVQGVGENESINVAGKNFASFDKRFLEKLPNWNKILIKQRIFDPAILFFDPAKDEYLPSLSDCKKRADINGIITHNALEDAWDVIQVLDHKFAWSIQIDKLLDEALPIDVHNK